MDVRKDAQAVLMGGVWKLEESQACKWEGL